MKEHLRTLPYTLYSSDVGWFEELSLEDIIHICNENSHEKRFIELAKKHGLEGDKEGEVLKKIKAEYESNKLTLEDKDDIIKILNEESLHYSDYKFENDIFKVIDYEPFITSFECSGKIIVENDLRQFFNDEDFDVNSKKGIIQTMEHYAKQGMLHGFVGNSSPTLLFSKKDKKIIIGADYDEYESRETDGLPNDSYKELAYVCTDLWWYSIVDVEHFKKLHPETDMSSFTIVDVPKGTWELRHNYGISSHSYPYATIEMQKRRIMTEKK